MWEQCRAYEREGKFKKAQLIKKHIEEELLKDEAKVYEEIQGKQENERIELEDSHLLEYQEFIGN